jgi:hypothetical protein
MKLHLDEAVLALLKKSHGMTYSEIKKALDGSKIRDKKLSNSLKRLEKYGEIRKVLYYDFSSKPKVYYIRWDDDTFIVSNEDKKDPRIHSCLRREVTLNNGKSCYYFVYLNFFGEEIDHDLTPIH